VIRSAIRTGTSLIMPLEGEKCLDCKDSHALSAHFPRHLSLLGLVLAGQEYILLIASGWADATCSGAMHVDATTHMRRRQRELVIGIVDVSEFSTSQSALELRVISRQQEHPALGENADSSCHLVDGE
jgi:hypothetical protein